MGAPKKKPNIVIRAFRYLPTIIDRFFKWYGGFIADHAVWFIIAPIIIALVLAPGMLQLRRIQDDTKSWPMTGSFTINNGSAKAKFNSHDSICVCTVCDKNNENCYKTSDCPDQAPKLCLGADAGLDPSCPHIQLMFLANNKTVSMTDSVVVEILMEIDMLISFEVLSLSKSKLNFFSTVMAPADLSIPAQQLCLMRSDGSCIQYSVLTGLRSRLARLPGLGTYEAQNQFIKDLQKPENQKQFRGLLGGNSDTYYPFDSDKPNAALTGPIFGNVELVDANQTWRNGWKAAKVKRIGAMQMYYCLNDTDPFTDDVAEWSRNATKFLEQNYGVKRTPQMKKKRPLPFELTVASTWSRLDRNGEEIVRMIPYLIVCIIGLMVFCGLTTLRGHPAHRTLPWIGPIGVGTSVLGVGSAFGLVGWLQWPIVDLCFAIPILVLAVGIDDIFVYTESWRATKPEWIIKRRMGITMKTAAPGIVVTSFMNSLAFIIDTQSPFLVLSIFSNVSVCAAFFDLIFQMTLFPAAMSLLASAEKKNQNALCCCCVRLRPRTNYDYRQANFCTMICCTAPKSTMSFPDEILVKQKGRRARLMHKEPADDTDGSKSKVAIKAQHFFHDIYTPFLLTPKMSAFAMALYAGYLVVCAVLATRIHVGLRFENTAPDIRGGKPNEVAIYLEHFRAFSFPIDILFMGDVQYWRKDVQEAIDDFYEDLMKVPYIGNDLINRNWLRDFKKHAATNNYNISSEEQFLYYLRKDFFNDTRWRNRVRQDMLYDVKFADRSMSDYYENYEVEINGWLLPRIVYSRILLNAVDVKNLEVSGIVVRRLRDVKSKHIRRLADVGVETAIYSREFVDTEPMLATAYIVVYNTLVQLAAVLMVTALMMPHPVAVFWIAIMLSSITVGVVTITCSWGIDFDQIAMINIMLTMGYCVDFSAHMTRTYVSSKGKTRYEKTREALGEFGFAVIQSSVAAVMAVLCLGASYAYILRCGFKFFFVGILLSVFHTLIVFPVFLLYLGPQPLKQHKKVKSLSDSKHRRRRRKTLDQPIEDEDARKMAQEIEKNLRRENQKRMTTQNKPWSVSYCDAIMAARIPSMRTWVPPLLKEIPHIDEMVAVMDFTNNRNNASMHRDNKMGDLSTHGGAPSSVSNHSSYETPPQY